MDLRGLIADAQAIQRLPEVLVERCVHARVAVASCERCVTACPTQAWILDDDQLTLDPNRCDGCGLCVAACPEGALAHDREPALRQWGGQTTAFAACDQTAHRLGDAAVPCVHGIGLEQLARLYGSGVRRLLLCTAACSECPRGVGEQLASRAALLNQVLEQRSLPTLVIETLGVTAWRERYEAAAAAHPGPNLSRRGFLRSVLVAAAETESRPAAPPQWRPPGEHLPRSADTLVALYVPQIDPQRCNGCDACVRVCPHGALRLNADATAYVIAVDGCTGCALCLDVCDQRAVRVASGAALTSAAVPLVKGHCRGCGAAYHRPLAGQKDVPLCRVCLQTGHHRSLFQVLS